VSERLTVAIPFYRNVDYLRSALDSVRAQRCDDWTAIVCDDAGRDCGAGDLVESLGDSRIAYVSNEANLGMARSWNLCIDRADTDLVTLLHADDRLAPGYVGRMLELARAWPDSAALCCAASIIGPTGRAAFSLADSVKRFYVPRGGDPLALHGEPALAAVMAGNFIMCPTLCFRKTVLGSRRFDTTWKQVPDLELTARLLMDGDTIVYTRAVEYAYRRHPEATTALQSETRLRFDEEIDLFDRVAARAEDLGWTRAARTARSKTIVKLHLAYRTLGGLARLDLAGASGWLRYLLGVGSARPPR